MGLECGINKLERKIRRFVEIEERLWLQTKNLNNIISKEMHSFNGTELFEPVPSSSSLSFREIENYNRLERLGEYY